jgi:hypothetical protein
MSNPLSRFTTRAAYGASQLQPRRTVRAALAAPMDFGEILEKKPRAVKECQQRSVMIGGKRVNAGLDISEILLEKDGHIRVEAPAIGGSAATRW